LRSIHTLEPPHSTTKTTATQNSKGVAPSRRFALVPLGPPVLSYSSTAKVCFLVSFGAGELALLLRTAFITNCRQMANKPELTINDNKPKPTPITKPKAMIAHNDAAKRVELVVDRAYEVRGCVRLSKDGRGRLYEIKGGALFMPFAVFFPTSQPLN
jgi:hypothetical protein